MSEKMKVVPVKTPAGVDVAKEKSTFRKVAEGVAKGALMVGLAVATQTCDSKITTTQTFGYDTDAQCDVLSGDVAPESGDLYVPDTKDVKTQKTCAQKEDDASKTVYTIMLGGVATQVSVGDQATEDGNKYTVDLTDNGKVILYNNAGMWKITVGDNVLVADNGDTVELYGQKYTLNVEVTADGKIMATLKGNGNTLNVDSVESADIVKDVLGQYDTSYFNRRLVLNFAGSDTHAAGPVRQIAEEGSNEGYTVAGYAGTQLTLKFTGEKDANGNPIMEYSSTSPTGLVFGGQFVASVGQQLVQNELVATVEVVSQPVVPSDGDKECAKVLSIEVKVNGVSKGTVTEGGANPLPRGDGVSVDAEKIVPGDSKSCAKLKITAETDGGKGKVVTPITCQGDSPYAVTSPNGTKEVTLGNASVE